VTKGNEYTEQRHVSFEACYREHAMRQIIQRAAKPGLSVVAVAQAP